MIKSLSPIIRHLQCGVIVDLTKAIWGMNKTAKAKEEHELGWRR